MSNNGNDHWWTWFIRALAVATGKMVLTLALSAFGVARRKHRHARHVVHASSSAGDDANGGMPRTFTGNTMPGLHFQAKIESVCFRLAADGAGNEIPVADCMMSLAPSQPVGQSFFPLGQGQVRIEIQGISSPDIAAGDLVQVDVMRVQSIPPPPLPPR